MKKLALIFVMFVSVFKLEACMNYYHSQDKKGNLHSHDNKDLYRAFNKNFNAPLNEKRLISTEARLKKTKSYQDLSNYAVRLTKVGKHKEALEILKVLGVKHPTEYQIIANLGTAYELNGELDSALTYIRKGLQLNPGSHEGSEWVHERILITKIALKKDPTYLTKNTILNIKETDKGYNLYAHQILIQLRERMPYCPPQNLIMQHLLLELGDVYVNSSSIKFGISLYEIAKHYYDVKPIVVDPKIATAKVYLAENMKKKVGKYLSEERGRVYEGKSYKSLLDNNNPTNYQVDWNKVNISVPELLAIVGYE